MSENKLQMRQHIVSYHYEVDLDRQAFQPFLDRMLSTMLIGDMGMLHHVDYLNVHVINVHIYLELSHLD